MYFYFADEDTTHEEEETHEGEAHEGGGHEEALNGKHFGADTNEIIWGSIAFFVVVALLVRLAGPAVKKGLAARTARIEAELDDAKQQRAAAESAAKQVTSDIPDVDAEASRIRAEAKETAERLKVDIAEKALADAEAIRARGAVDVENAKKQALADLTAEVGGLTRQAAEAVVVETLDDAAHAELIEGYIAQVGQL